MSFMMEYAGIMLIANAYHQRQGYYWPTMEEDCYNHVKKCVKCQIHADLIKKKHIFLPP